MAPGSLQKLILSLCTGTKCQRMLWVFFFFVTVAAFHHLSSCAGIIAPVHLN